MRAAMRAGGKDEMGPGGAQADSLSPVFFLQGAIEALVSNDLAELERLVRSLDHLEPLPQGPELAEALCLHRLLGALLQETRRNLRLLRRAAGRRTHQAYGPFDS
jgi:hypothetical protein